MANTNIFLKPNEVKFLAIAVLSVLEQIQNSSKDVTMPFNPEARRYFKEMIEAGTSLKIKIEKLGIDMSDLEDYKPGDEDEFLTKQS